jgi:hypothetical protein
MAEGGHGRWPFGTDELVVSMTDMAIMGHSVSKSSNDVRSHRFLLNNRECMIVPYLACQLSVFYKLN